MTNKTHISIRTLIALSMLFTVYSCFYDEIPVEDIPENTIISYSLDIQPIFDNNCTLCHPLISPKPDLSESSSYEAIKADGYIVPENLEKSVLYQRLIGNPNVMPPSGPLAQKDIDLVRKWIEQGALNN